MKKQQFKLVLSPKAIQYIQDQGIPIANYQFIGYIFSWVKGINGVLGIDGSWGICSSFCKKDKRIKKLNKWKINKTIRQMIRVGFLIKIIDGPFSEFEYYNNINMDLSKIQYLDEKLFDNI